MLSRKLIGLGFIIFGVVLLFITSLGHWFGAGGYSNQSPQNWERFDPALMEQTPDFDSLYQAAIKRAADPIDKLHPKEVMKVLYEAVIDRFTHGESARHNFYSNWILWGMGKFHSSFSKIISPDILLKNGHSARCSQTSYVLVRLAQEAGIRPRHVGLYGHVVMEAWYDGDWHLYDPDFEVAAINEQESTLNVEDLSRNEDLVLKAYAGRGTQSQIKEIAKIITSRENNTFMSYPVGSQFVWTAEILIIIEKVAEFMKFILPGFLILIGRVLLKKPRGENV